jgi:hypothetical protein
MSGNLFCFAGGDAEAEAEPLFVCLLVESEF